MPDYFYAMLKDGVLVMLPAKDIHNIKAEVEQLKEMGYKLPRFSEQFTPVKGHVVRMELHDKKTKTGKEMYRFYVKELGAETEHMVIAFEKTAFPKGALVIVSMGNYGKQAVLANAGWDEEGDDEDKVGNLINDDDIPY